MLGRLGSKLLQLKRKIAEKIAEHPEGAAILAALVGQTDNSTTTTTASTFDLSGIIDVVVAVIPLFVLVAVLKMLFGAFRQMS